MSPQIPRILAFVFFAAAVPISSAAAAEACCPSADSPAACEMYKKFDVAFVGRAIDVPPDREEGQATVRFRVTQSLKGVGGSEVSVLNESVLTCGYDFKKGEDYVVFARRDADGGLDLGRCAKGVWMVHPSPHDFAAWFRRESDAVVAFAESMRKPATGGHIFGEVWLDPAFASLEDDDEQGKKPVDGATIILQGPADVRRTTSVNGHYEFTGLPPGTYRVSVTMPDGLPPALSARPAEALMDDEEDGPLDYVPEYARSVTIADARSCGYAPFGALFLGEIAGSVVQADGTPADRVAVQILPAALLPRLDDSVYGPTVETDADGGYRLQHLPPGRYIVGVNLRDYLLPVRATPYRERDGDGPAIVELGWDTHVDLGVLRLPPPSVKRQIAGTVKWSDGRDLGVVRVEVFEDRPGNEGTIAHRTVDVGPDGAFSTEIFEGRTYVVKAEAADPRGWWEARGEPIPIPPIVTTAMTITLDRDRRDLRLVLDPDRDRR